MYACMYMYTCVRVSVCVRVYDLCNSQISSESVKCPSRYDKGHRDKGLLKHENVDSLFTQ